MTGSTGTCHSLSQGMHYNSKGEQDITKGITFFNRQIVARRPRLNLRFNFPDIVPGFPLHPERGYICAGRQDRPEKAGDSTTVIKSVPGGTNVHSGRLCLPQALTTGSFGLTVNAKHTLPFPGNSRAIVFEPFVVKMDAVY